MNPIEINIKVGLEDSTLKILTDLMTAAVRTEDKKPQDPVQEARAAVEKAEEAVSAAEQRLNEARTVKPTTRAKKPAPAEVKEEPRPAEPAPAIDDMPDFEEQNKEITDTDLRAIVTETRQRVGSAAPIRALMAERFGIKVSTDCPQDKRQEFINALKEL